MPLDAPGKRPATPSGKDGPGAGRLQSGLAAVSYTQLGVYKRQGEGMALATGADEGIDRGERSRADFDPGIRGLHTGRDRQHRAREGDPQPLVHAVPQVRLGEAER